MNVGIHRVRGLRSMEAESQVVTSYLIGTGWDSNSGLQLRSSGAVSTLNLSPFQHHQCFDCCATIPVTGKKYRKELKAKTRAEVRIH